MRSSTPRARPGAGTVPLAIDPHAAGEDGPSAVMNRAVGEKSFDASGEAGEHATQPLERVLARALGSQVARPGRQRAIDRVIDDEPAVDHVREAVPQPLLAQLGKQQPHVVVGPRQAAADVERAIQRLLHQARHLRLVGHLEAGIEVRLERKLAKQRQAERVDGADGDVARSLAHVAPQLLIRPCGLGALAQLVQDAAAHLGGRFARERDGEDVRRLDAAAQQVEIPVDEHMRLAGAGRRLEHHVVRGIDSALPRCRVGQIVQSRESRVQSRLVGLWTLDSGLVIERQPVRRRQRSPSGTRRRARSGCTSSCPRASAEIRRARFDRPHRAAASARRASVVSLVFPRASIGTNCRSWPNAM